MQRSPSAHPHTAAPAGRWRPSEGWRSSPVAAAAGAAARAGEEVGARGAMRCEQRACAGRSHTSPRVQTLPAPFSHTRTSRTDTYKLVWQGAGRGGGLSASVIACLPTNHAFRAPNSRAINLPMTSEERAAAEADVLHAAQASPLGADLLLSALAAAAAHYRRATGVRVQGVGGRGWGHTMSALHQQPARRTTPRTHRSHSLHAVPARRAVWRATPPRLCSGERVLAKPAQARGWVGGGGQGGRVVVPQERRGDAR